MKIIKQQKCDPYNLEIIKAFITKKEWDRKGHTTQDGEKTIMVYLEGSGTCLIPAIVIKQELYDALPIAEYY
jgi:hypothetical protein